MISPINFNSTNNITQLSTASSSSKKAGSNNIKAAANNYPKINFNKYSVSFVGNITKNKIDPEDSRILFDGIRKEVKKVQSNAEKISEDSRNIYDSFSEEMMEYLNSTLAKQERGKKYIVDEKTGNTIIISKGVFSNFGGEDKIEIKESKDDQIVKKVTFKFKEHDKPSSILYEEGRLRVSLDNNTNEMQVLQGDFTDADTSKSTDIFVYIKNGQVIEYTTKHWIRNTIAGPVPLKVEQADVRYTFSESGELKKFERRISNRREGLLMEDYTVDKTDTARRYEFENGKLKRAWVNLREVTKEPNKKTDSENSIETVKDSHEKSTSLRAETLVEYEENKIIQYQQYHEGKYGIDYTDSQVFQY